MDNPSAQIRSINIEDEIRSSYLDYSMSVIVGRALPDVRDGLKPVHRRILFAMSELGNEWNKAYKKSARVVGDVIGKYHPHGDSAIYDALVRMAQPWSLRHPLADGQGNFGSIDGDPPAAMRYTEVRMDRISSQMLADIDKDTVDWQPNYDESSQEPRVLPARIPNLLINGSSGIAVGMSTNIPPHNLEEVVNAAIALIENPQLTSLELMSFVPGPDFPTAGIIARTPELEKAYTTGRGILTVRGRANFEEDTKRGKTQIIITEIPYQLNKTRLIENIADLVRNKRLDGISDIRDESSRKGMRIVLDLRKEANPKIVLRRLYKHTPLQSSFGVILLAIVNNRPEVLTLRGLLRHFINHRKVVVTRRTRFELRKAEDRAHILEGYRIALDHLDEVIKTIRAASNPAEARTQLITRFEMSERQAQAVLDLRLQRLTGMERDKINAEYAEIQIQITYLRGLLADETKLFGVIKEELIAVRDQFADPRRTEILDVDFSLSDEDLIPVEEMIVTISHEGYIKRLPVMEYQTQKRGGYGKVGMATKDSDFVSDVFVASTHSYLLFFTKLGRAHWLKVYNVPKASRTGRGKPVVNVVELVPGDGVASVLPVTDFGLEKSIVVSTRKGVVKRMRLKDFSRPRTAGILASTVDDGDEIICVRLIDDAQDVLLSTATGRAIRFAATDVRVMGRGARGVRGISLLDDDLVIGMAAVDDDSVILTITQNGYGKRTQVSEYRRQGRGGQGIIDIKTGDRNGNVIGMIKVEPSDDILMITDSGRMIRTAVEQISLIGRNTKGVTVMRLEEDESVAGLALVAEKDDDDSEDLEVEASSGSPTDGSETAPEVLAEGGDEDTSEEEPSS